MFIAAQFIITNSVKVANEWGDKQTIACPCEAILHGSKKERLWYTWQLRGVSKALGSVKEDVPKSLHTVWSHTHMTVLWGGWWEQGLAGVRAGGGRRWCELGGRFGGDASLWWWQPCACENSQTCTLYTSSLTVCGPATSWKIDGETVETVRDFIFLDSKIRGSKIHCRWWLQPWNLLAPRKKRYDQPRQHMKTEILLCQQRSI